MPQVSKQIISKKFQKKLDDLFFESFSSLSPYNTEDFIDDLFTPTEKVMISKRIFIAYLLLEGHSYRSISHILKVSTTTVNRIKSIIDSDSEGYKKIISSINRKSKVLDTISKEFTDIFIRKYPTKSLPRK